MNNKKHAITERYTLADMLNDYNRMYALWGEERQARLNPKPMAKAPKKRIKVAK